MAGDSPADQAADLLIATILRHRRSWQVMWIGARKELRDLRDFSAATLEIAVTKASTTAAEFYRGNPSSAAAKFLLLIFGRRLPVFAGPQLLVTGEPGHFTATDEDDSVFHGATLEDLLAAAGANPVRPGDYAINWIRPVSALFPDPTPDQP